MREREKGRVREKEGRERDMGERKRKKNGGRWKSRGERWEKRPLFPPLYIHELHRIWLISKGRWEHCFIKLKYNFQTN